ncbi:hypothetical protein KBC79_05120 [Candidatus Woesebacteria bacterium]|nr:hypothetical protein [Candidatus Woesebacteria bacterium]
MQQYLFQLGNTPELSLSEIRAVFPESSLSQVHTQVALGDFPLELDTQQAIERLGGTVKILAPLVATDKKIDQASATEQLVHILAKTYKGTGKVQFGISEIGRDHLPPVSESEIKNQLQSQGINSRFVSPSRSGISAAVLSHHRSVTELVVISTDTNTYIGQTLAVQDIDNWSKRDRSKPYADRKKGMLPPKLARMMINLALGTTNPTATTVYDPFCGSGTVLMEAGVLGCHLIGTDSDPVAIDGTARNLQWLKTQYGIEDEYVLRNVDVSKAQLPPDSVTHLVTEPFLGKPTPKLHQLPGIFKGLEKLYRGAFKQWTRFLQDNAKIVIVMPMVTTPHHTYSLSSFVDDLEALGYTTSSEPIVYARPQAIVQRTIYQFNYTKK